jgi:hypothetical protein
MDGAMDGAMDGTMDGAATDGTAVGAGVADELQAPATRATMATLAAS